MKNKVILAVDDDEDILKILNKILVASGFQVQLAQSPEEARQLMVANPPHLIISDLNMPVENGYSFIQSVRRQKQFQDVPIIVLSAVNDFNSVKKVISLGISDYVIKPLQAPLLIRKLKKALMYKDFSSWKAPPGEELEVELKIATEVVEMGETGYRLSGPFKLTPGKEFKITTPAFVDLGLSQIVQKASNLMKVYSSGGVFLNDITFIAINEEASSRIRQYVKRSRK